ncbi:fam-c protein [Plasmodium vinckei brucechwatti]|uniref:Fam-c protein n=1 Tax=Plasmodium vinckei brucechwatti TaxID=119398 RepID=A0A6V7RTZ8_PLAVN|nr:fam-c protein [Plasmodium vinckei brucechwatti]
MNKRIFSLVCILFYVFMAVSIYCSEQKVVKTKYKLHDQSKKYGLRSKIIRAFKKTKRNNKKNDIESQREIQSNNNNNANVSDSDDDYFKYRNRKEDEKMQYRRTYCCGLFTEYAHSDDSYKLNNVG